jgi:hypothetical protein
MMWNFNNGIKMKYMSNDPSFYHLSPMEGVSESDAVRGIKNELMDLIIDFGLPNDDRFFDDFMNRVKGSLYEVKYCKYCEDYIDINEFSFDPSGLMCDSCSNCQEILYKSLKGDPYFINGVKNDY